MSTEFEAIIKAILTVEELPTQSDCIKVMEHFETAERGSWGKFCKQNGIYQIVHDELVNGLYALISGLTPTNLLEVCAGNGKLTYWLNRKSLNIKSIDDHSWEGIQTSDRVEYLTCAEALKRYAPDLVIACFPCEKTTLPIDILKFPSVRYFIHLGNAGRSPGKNWREEIERMNNVIERDLYKEIYTYPTFDDDMEADRSNNRLYKVNR